jgi:hypothetical protein
LFPAPPQLASTAQYETSKKIRLKSTRTKRLHFTSFGVHCLWVCRGSAGRSGGQSLQCSAASGRESGPHVHIRQFKHKGIHPKKRGNLEPKRIAEWRISVVAQEQSRACPSVYLSPFVLREHTVVLFTNLMKMPIVGTKDEQYLGGGLFSATSCVDHRAFRFCGV